MKPADNFDLKKFITENTLLKKENQEKDTFNNIALDSDGNKIKINDIVGLINANITDGNGEPISGNEFKVVRINPKTITIEPTFQTWLRQVNLKSNQVKLK